MTKTIPDLHSVRLLLRHFTRSDAHDVARYVGDKEIAATTLSIPHPYSLEMAVEWIDTHAELYARGESINFAITLADTHQLIGAIGLVLYKEHDRAEMGYWVGKPHWNRGFASEAARSVVDFGFKVWQLERIYAHHFATNPVSGKVMVNAGMQYEGCLRHHIKKWGQYQDLNVYSVLRDEWLLAER